MKLLTVILLSALSVSLLPNRALASKRLEMWVTVTNYSPQESCRDARCITASGKPAKAGVTIACPREIKLGTHVVVENHEYVCQDRTAKYLNGRYDIFVLSHAAAIKWGKRKVKVTIL